MTEKELKELGEYLGTTKATKEGQKLFRAIKEGKRTPESLTDREVVLCISCNQGYAFFLLFEIGTVDKKKQGVKLMREALKEGKRFFIGRDEAEGDFENDEEMEKYMSQLEFHMSLI